MSTAIKVNSLYEQLNPTFYQIYLTDKPNKLAKGGRSGTKSSAISQILVEKLARNPQANAMCFRQKANTLRMSVYNQIMWALVEAGIDDQYTFRSNPMTILHKKHKTGFYFSGMDDPQKIKSIKIERGYLTDLWFEEADALRDYSEIDTVQDSFIRENLPNGLEVNTWVSYNPPRNKFHWINEWAESLSNSDSWFVHHSTYKDDLKGYNSNQILKKIQEYKENDFDYYQWMYLGKIIGLGDNVYNVDTVKIIDEVFEDDPVLDIALSADIGHQVSATGIGKYGITAKGNVILLDTYYYDPSGKRVKKAPSELSKDAYEFAKNDFIYKRTIDSAEGGFRNQYFKDYNSRWNGVKKQQKHKMIDYTHDLLAQGRFYILNKPQNMILYEQMKRFEWDETTLRTDKPKPIEVDDHMIDTFIYFVMDNLRRLGLKR